jgi:hypothetical protein
VGGIFTVCFGGTDTSVGRGGQLGLAGAGYVTEIVQGKDGGAPDGDGLDNDGTSRWAKMNKFLQISENEVPAIILL